MKDLYGVYGRFEILTEGLGNGRPDFAIIVRCTYCKATLVKRRFQASEEAIARAAELASVDLITASAHLCAERDGANNLPRKEDNGYA